MSEVKLFGHILFEQQDSRSHVTEGRVKVLLKRVESRIKKPVKSGYGKKGYLGSQKFLW